jgi:hypothetical protein
VRPQVAHHPARDKKSSDHDAAPVSAPATAAAGDDAPVTHMGGVTIVNTAALARQKTGLKAINAVPPAPFDPIRYLPTAQGLARRLMPDARLTRLHIEYALSDGTALLRADDGVDYTFRSPAHSGRPTDVPANVDVDIPCMIHVWVRRGKVQASPVTDERCHQPFVPRPRCSAAQLWRMAFPKGPPRPNLAAQIDYDKDGWSFEVPGAFAGKPVDGDEDFSTTLRDTCR